MTCRAIWVYNSAQSAEPHHMGLPKPFRCLRLLVPLAVLLLPGSSSVHASPALLTLPQSIAIPADMSPAAAAAFFSGSGGAGTLPSWGRFTPPLAVAGEASQLSYNGISLPRVVFTSQDSVGTYIVSAIDHTKKDLKLALYDFNLREILAALERASRREDPVRIRVVLDQRHVFPPRGPPSTEIQAIIEDPRIEVRMIRGLRSFGTMHNKIGIFDDTLAEFGSFNWGWAAETMHYENAIFTTESGRVAAYRAYWQWMWDNGWPTDAPRSSPKDLGPPPADSSRPAVFNRARFPGAVFSPEGGAAEWIFKAIRLSKKSIDIAMFNFSSQGLADALVESKERGVKMRIIMDRWQTGGSSVIGYLRENGFEVLVMGGREGNGAMHHKFAIFDGKMVETGAYNWSWNAEANSFENINFLSRPSVVAAYAAEFQSLINKATPIDRAVLPGLASILGHPDLE